MNPYIIAERKEGSCEIEEGVTEFCHPAFDRFSLRSSSVRAHNMLPQFCIITSTVSCFIDGDRKLVRLFVITSNYQAVNEIYLTASRLPTTQDSAQRWRLPTLVPSVSTWWSSSRHSSTSRGHWQLSNRWPWSAYTHFRRFSQLHPSMQWWSEAITLISTTEFDITQHDDRAIEVHNYGGASRDTQ